MVTELFPKQKIPPTVYTFHIPSETTYDTPWIWKFDRSLEKHLTTTLEINVLLRYNEQ